jgi:2-phosphoglycerate kinase
MKSQQGVQPVIQRSLCNGSMAIVELIVLYVVHSLKEKELKEG